MSDLQLNVRSVIANGRDWKLDDGFTELLEQILYNNETEIFCESSYYLGYVTNYWRIYLADGE
jgi:hypothetical protein